MILDDLKSFWSWLTRSSGRRHKKVPIQVEIKRIPESTGGSTEVDVVLSSEDIPEQHFRKLVQAIRDNPNLTPTEDGPDARNLDHFCKLLRSSDGFIFVVDIIREATADEFSRGTADKVWKAFGEQIEAIACGVFIASKHNRDLRHKPMFFVVSKPDRHGLDEKKVSSYFNRVLAIILSQLERELINVKLYSVKCAGWEIDSNLEDLGLDALVSDLIHGIGAVEVTEEMRT